MDKPEEDQDEAAPLLRGPTPSRPPCKISYPVELIALMYFFASITVTPLVTQYVYHRVSLEVLGLNQTVDIDLCNTTRDNATSELQRLQNKAQTISSHWGMWMSLASAATSIFSTICLGAYTDYFGRRLALMLPCLGDLLQAIIMTAVMYFKMGFAFLVVAKALGGLGGGFGTMLMAVFSSTADTSSHRQRTIRITIMEVIGQISIASSQLFLGYYIKWTGYFVPMATNGVILLASAIMTRLVVPNVRTRQGAGGEKMKNVFVYCKETLEVLLKHNQGGRRTRLLLLLSAFSCLSIASLGRTTADTLYLLDRPFCWASTQIGFFSALLSLPPNIASVLVVHVFGKVLGVSEIPLGISGCISAVLGFVTMALARDSWQLYLVPAASIIWLLAFPMIRALASKAVSPQEQGSVFANIAVLETICANVGSALLTAVYGATTSSLRQAVYLVNCGFIVLTVVFLSLTALHGKFWYKAPRQLSEVN